MSNRVVAIRRFPVKTMGGEALERVAITHAGLAGDRAYAVTCDDGRFASGKNGTRFQRRDAIFGYRANLQPDARGDAPHDASVRVWRERSIRHQDGDSPRDQRGALIFEPDPAGPWPIDDPALLDDLRETVGTDVSLHRSDERFFDASPVSIIGTATCEWAARELGAANAGRRLRANLVIETSEPFEEERWQDGSVTIGASGGVVCAVDRVVNRCRMIDLPQDGVANHARFLQALTDRRGPKLAVYANVLRAGSISVGDDVVVDS